MRDYISNLYKVANKSPDPLTRENAQREISGLFNAYESSMFEHKAEDYKMVASQCARCGSVLTGLDAELYSSRRGACSVCGYSGGIVTEPRHLLDT